MLTVCTVSYGHARHLALNRAIAARTLGPAAASLRWLVAENAPEGVAGRMADPTPGFEVRRGVIDRREGASAQHAVALETLLRAATSRFLLVLDPDFYIVLPHWAWRVLDHMQRRGLAFFGAPWHPRYSENYRYFPAVHCMFIDTQRVRVDELDFRPLLHIAGTVPLTTVRRRGLWHHLVEWVPLLHRRRRPWDTGTLVYKRFHGDPQTPAECVIPVYRSPPVPDRLERLLPDGWSYLPKDRRSFVSDGFRERGVIPMALPELWEEHWWQGSPFGLHMRRSYASERRDDSDELVRCGAVLDALVAPRGPASGAQAPGQAPAQAGSRAGMDAEGSGT